MANTRSGRTGPKPTRTKLAYLAGFIDGEGCIRLNRGCVTLSVTNTYYPQLLELKAVFGGNTYDHMPRKGKRRQSFKWVITGAQARLAIKRLYPYLVEKKPQAYIALSLHEFPKNTPMRAAMERTLTGLKRAKYH